MKQGVNIALANIPSLALFAAALYLVATGHSWWSAPFLVAGFWTLHIAADQQK